MCRCGSILESHHLLKATNKSLHLGGCLQEVQLYLQCTYIISNLQHWVLFAGAEVGVTQKVLGLGYSRV